MPGNAMEQFKSCNTLSMPEKRPTFDTTTFWMSMTAMKNHWSKYFKLLLSRKIEQMFKNRNKENKENYIKKNFGIFDRLSIQND